MAMSNNQMVSFGGVTGSGVVESHDISSMML